MSCTNCYLDLCEVLVCDEKATLDFPHVVDTEGEYKFILSYLGTAKAYTKNFLVGERLVIDLDCLNENYCYEGYIINPNNEVLTIFTDTANTAFKFCTKQLSLCQN